MEKVGKKIPGLLNGRAVENKMLLMYAFCFDHDHDHHQLDEGDTCHRTANDVEQEGGICAGSQRGGHAPPCGNDGTPGPEMF